MGDANRTNSVERCRKEADVAREQQRYREARELDEAADTIESLQAEVERVRDALRMVAVIARRYMDTAPGLDPAVSIHQRQVEEALRE